MTAASGMSGEEKASDASGAAQAITESIWDRHAKATEGQQKEADKRLELVLAYKHLESEGWKQSRILKELRNQFGNRANKATLWRYLDRIKGQDQNLWLPLLLPEWEGRTTRAFINEELFEAIQRDYLRPSKPSFSAVYRRAKTLAASYNWQIPSEDAVFDRLRAEIPHDQMVYLRGGDKALKELHASHDRDYGQLDLHEIWNSDGHKADLFVIDKSGNVFRPMVVAWMEVRSRVIVGYVVTDSETADSVRRSFHRAVDTYKCLPRFALLDNGRAYAAKEITGGVPTRYRFKKKESECLGILPAVGVKVIWATPGHGQAKPIESFWRVLTEMAKRAEFDEAYCGNKPDARPENFDKGKAVPLSEFKRILDETILDYHAKPHDGNAMSNLAPDQVYRQMIAKANYPIQQPTTGQKRLLQLKVEGIKLKGKAGIIVLKETGNKYWCPSIKEIPRSIDYAVRYDPDDLTKPVILELNGKVLMEVPPLGAVPFRDSQAGAMIAKSRREMTKATKVAAAASKKHLRSYSQISPKRTDSPTPAPTASLPKVPQLVHTSIQVPRSKPQPGKRLNFALADIVQFPAREEKQTPKASIDRTAILDALTGDLGRNVK